MSGFTPSHAFASISTKNTPQFSINQPAAVSDMENLFRIRNTTGSIGNFQSDRLIKVIAVGEVSLPPDRCRISVKVHSQKENVQDVKNSVQRRLDYILQTFQNHNVKETDIKVNKSLRRIEGMYDYVTEVVVVFLDFNKSQSACNLLVEKLDETVSVGMPEFYHAATTLETLRQQASLLAIHNAKQKAQEMAKFVHQTVGRPVSIQEEESKEWEGQIEGVSDVEARPTVQQLMSQAVVTVSCKVNVTFELKSKVKTKVNKE